jgi:crotonobetainyl-CoA:carnitine CoA-transferase CaiB-like acyl-CoA transferase
MISSEQGRHNVPMSLLSGLRVIELGCTPKAGFCGKMLVDVGAEVIKVSLPTYDAVPPFSSWLDRGKASVVLDWRAADGRALLIRLLETASLLISDLECEGEDRELAKIAAALPQLVHVSVSDLGHDGPFATRPSTDLIVSALSGMCYINGEAGRLPLREPGNQSATVAGIAAYIGALAALVAQSETDEGQSVEVSALEAMVNVLSPSVLQSSYQNGAPARHPSADGFLFDCADGKVSIIVSAQRSWDTLLDLWGITPSPEDEHKFTEDERRKHLPEIRELLAPALALRTRHEIFEELCSVHIPCGMLLAPWEIVEDPHIRERGSFDTLASDSAGDRVFPGPAFRVAGERPATHRMLPVFGGQTASILAPLVGKEVTA